ncbi:MAG: FKBP-type peptidyl-prolyl cis-trans isomerase [Verrucomicrobiaceae bacterium]|nr:FKBP-type peptidyl-prolyl cis-trans isomerase [Verrucomicrobiaceae bacterium]
MKSLLILLTSTLLLAGCGSPALNHEAAETASGSHSIPSPTKTTDASGYVTTASGLRYKVLASGPASGQRPTMNDTVVVHYRGTLVDGSVFDSSYDRGQPASFGVSQVIPGWTQALQMMRPGDKWLIQIPFNLAYGSRGSPPKIPPFADLIFQVELLNVLH